MRMKKKRRINLFMYRLLLNTSPLSYDDKSFICMAIIIPSFASRNIEIHLFYSNFLVRRLCVLAKTTIIYKYTKLQKNILLEYQMK